MKPIKTILYTAAVCLLLSTGCEKADVGKSGLNGIDGNANIFNKAYPISSTQWINGPDYWLMDLPVDELTITTASTAGVQVYWGEDDTWYAIPYTSVRTTGNYFMGFITSVDNVRISWTYNSIGHGSNPCNILPGNFKFFKVVVIPPSVMMKNPNLDLKDYQEVKKVLKLVE
jgi:hypothetical protein